MSDEQNTPAKRTYRRRAAAHEGDQNPLTGTTITPLPVGEQPVIQATPRRNAVLARRLAGNPHGTAQRAIPLKEPHRWQTYEANDYNNADDLYRMVHELGWEPLRPEDIACKPEEIGYRVSPDGHLVRGSQGREMLFKMTKEDYAVLKARETEANNATIGKPAKAKAAAANAVASVYGDEAATFVDKHLVGSIVDTQEPLP